MAEVPEAEPVPCSSETALAPDLNDSEEPLAKKPKISDKETSDKLEHRLGGILCCAVCLDLPPAAVYQCNNGHLMCAPCFTHLLADARLRDESATCPNCRVEISKVTASRNLAVEKTVSELPSECKYCTRVFPRHSLQHHEENTCEDRVYALLVGVLRRVPPAAVALKRRRYRRLTGCRYSCIGCPWMGPAHEAATHESACAHPSKSAADVMTTLAEREKRANEINNVYKQVLDLLSYEKITFNDLQLKPYRTEEFIHKLYYETSRFSAFGQQWVVKAFVNKNQRDPTQSSQREITYQLIMKSKSSCGVSVQWVLARGPYGEAPLSACVRAHVFHEDGADSPALPLPLAHYDDTNRLLSNKAIHLRLIMFLSSK